MLSDSKIEIEKIARKFKLELDLSWSWIIVFAAFMIHIISDGIVYSFGIFYTEIVHYYGYNRGAAAWVPSIMCGTINFVGPLAGALTNKYGCRIVCMIGSLIATVGFALSSLIFDIKQLYLTAGLCTGTGLGMMYLPAIISVNRYFDEKRAFATGLAVCGSGIGTFILAPVIELLIQKYSWKGAMLLTSGILLNGCIFGALLRPPSQIKKRQKTKDSIWSKERETVTILPRKSASLPILLEFPILIELNDSKLKFMHHYMSDPLDINEGEKYTKTAFGECIAEISIPKKFDVNKKFPIFIELHRIGLNFKIFRDPIFIVFIVSNLFTSLGMETISVYMIERIVHKNIASKRAATFLVSILGIFNTIGRITFGYISDKFEQNRLWLYIGSLAICGFSISISTFCFNYIQMSIFSAIFGLFYGAYISLLSIILVDLLGLEKLTDSFGFLLFFQGIGAFFGIPVTGWLYDKTGSFEPGFLLSGTAILLSSLVLFAIPVYQKRSAFEPP